MSKDYEYPPGSNDAVMRGCKCPMIDNSFGKGYMGTDRYVIRDDCPLHAEE